MNPEKFFNEEFQKELEAKQFPVGSVSSEWILQVFEALKFSSIISLGINPEDWFKLLAVAEKCEMTLYQFALLSNNLQARSPKELGLSLSDYGNLMAEADEYVKIWQGLTNEIRDEVNKRLEENMQMLAASKLSKPILQPVKGEA